MLRWMGATPRLEGFFYVPLWEAIFGTFLILVSVAMPLLFLKFNGIQVKQYPEWIFCLAFLVFFLWMGKTLAFQSFMAKMKADRVCIKHNLRGPDLDYERPLREWAGVKTATIADDQGRKMYTISMTATDGDTEVYRSVNSGEVEELKAALETLQRNSVEAK